MLKKRQHVYHVFTHLWLVVFDRGFAYFGVRIYNVLFCFVCYHCLWCELSACLVDCVAVVTIVSASHKICAWPAEWGPGDRFNMCHDSFKKTHKSVWSYHRWSDVGLRVWPRFNDTTMIQAKLQDSSAKFQAVHFTKCFEWWHDYWASCKSPKETTSKGTTFIRS